MRLDEDVPLARLATTGRSVHVRPWGRLDRVSRRLQQAKPPFPPISHGTHIAPQCCIMQHGIMEAVLPDVMLYRVLNSTL